MADYAIKRWRHMATFANIVLKQILLTTVNGNATQ